MDYEKMVADLIAGEIKEITVSREDFFTFREVWQNHPEKVKIVGEAMLGGSVIYTYHE